MSSPRPSPRKPSLLADRAPERRRARRDEPAQRSGTSFYRPRPKVTPAESADDAFVPGYN